MVMDTEVANVPWKGLRNLATFIQNPTREALLDGKSVEEALEGVDERDRAFMRDVLILSFSDPEILRTIVNARMRLNNDIKMTPEQASLLLEQLRCRGFDFVTVDVAGYEFGELHMADVAIGGDLKMEYVQISGSNYQDGMTVGGDNDQEGMTVGGYNNQGCMTVGGDNYQDGMTVGGSNYQDGMTVGGCNNQGCMTVGGDNYQDGMTVGDYNYQGCMTVGGDNYQDGMMVGGDNDQGGMTVKGKDSRLSPASA